MKINHGRVAGMPSSERGETFTGSVWSEPLLRDVPGVVINTVFGLGVSTGRAEPSLTVAV